MVEEEGLFQVRINISLKNKCPVSKIIIIIL